MPTRELFGTLNQSDGSPYALAGVSFIRKRATILGNENAPQQVTLTTDADGAFNVVLPCNAQGERAAEYACVLSGGTRRYFALTPGLVPIDLDTVLLVSGTPQLPTVEATLQAIVDANLPPALNRQNHTGTQLAETISDLDQSIADILAWSISVVPEEEGSPIFVGTNDPRLSPATSTQNGLLAIADKLKLDAATPSSAASTLVKRDEDETFGGLLRLNSYTKAGLPSPGSAGRIARVTDDARGLWIDTGTQWVALNGGVLNVKMFGAKGDGVTNDTDAFIAVSAAVNTLGGGVEINIPPGVYMVGQQTLNTGGYRYEGKDILKFVNCTKPILINGYGATLKLVNGLKFGSFAANGSVYNPSALPFYDSSYGATTGRMCYAIGCKSVTVRGLELDGNNVNYQIGGNWGDSDIQLSSYGFSFKECGNSFLSDVYVHNFGLDGIIFEYDTLTEASPPTPMTLINVRSEYNGRQGLSWVHGIGLTAINCTFSHTGYAVNVGTGQAVASHPMAGVDIEPYNTGVARRGIFINCRIEHNKRFGFIVPFDGLASDITLLDTTIWNFEGYALYAAAPRITVRDSRIYGAVTNVYVSSSRPQDAVKFYNTIFENKMHPTYGAAYAAGEYLSAFDNLASGGGLLFRDCQFIANNVEAPLFRASSQLISSRAFTLDNCTIVLSKNAYQAQYIAGGILINTRFVDETPAGLTDALIYTNGGKTNVLQGGNRIDGTKIKWGDGNQTGLLRNTESLGTTSDITAALGFTPVNAADGNFTGKITNYNGTATVGNGIPSTVATAALTAQAASIAATTLYTPPLAAGFYRLNGYLVVTTAGTAGTVILSYSYRDPSATIQSPAQSVLNLNTLGTYSRTNQIFYVDASGTPIQFSATVAGASGSPQFALFIILEKM